MVDLERVRAAVRAQSPLSTNLTERILSLRFESIPNRLAFGLAEWPLGSAAVLDVGCSYGHCLVHFGPGSVGVDNVAEHVDFCRSLGLEARLLDVDSGLRTVPDGAFDYLWVSDIVEHLDSPHVLLRRLAPKLKPGGRLLLYVSTLPRSRLAQRACRRFGVVSFEAATHYYQFTYETARFLVERAGFRVETAAVPLLRGRYRALTGLLRVHAPTIILEASPDDARGRALDEAGRKNKPHAARS